MEKCIGKNIIRRYSQCLDVILEALITFFSYQLIALYKIYIFIHLTFYNTSHRDF